MIRLRWIVDFLNKQYSLHFFSFNYQWKDYTIYSPIIKVLYFYYNTTTYLFEAKSECKCFLKKLQL